MAEVINLNRFRKKAERKRASDEASANRARFGRTKAEREREAQNAERARDRLDQHRIVAADAGEREDKA